MAGRRIYAILRDDGLLLHTVPVTEDEALWLLSAAYKSVKSRDLRIRYLSEWGSVMDAANYLELVERLPVKIGETLEGIYRPRHFLERVAWHARIPWLTAEARQALEEFVERAEDFLRRPAEPKPVAAPVRYYEMPRRHVTLASGPRGTAARSVRPRPEWFAYVTTLGVNPYGVSVFRDSFWLWRQYEDELMVEVHAVVVRRDVSDGDLVAALAGDEAAQGFLRNNAVLFRQVMRARGEELGKLGYGDVIRKINVILGAAELLSAGRREEEGEALPA